MQVSVPVIWFLPYMQCFGFYLISNVFTIGIHDRVQDGEFSQGKGNSLQTHISVQSVTQVTKFQNISYFKECDNFCIIVM